MVLYLKAIIAIFINQIREKVGVMFGSEQLLEGLKFMLLLD